MFIQAMVRMYSCYRKNTATKKSTHKIGHAVSASNITWSIETKSAQCHIFRHLFSSYLAGEDPHEKASRQDTFNISSGSDYKTEFVILNNDL